MSIASLKKKYSRKFKKELKSQIFILGSVGVGKTKLLKVLQQNLAMKDKGAQNMAGISLETITSSAEEIYAYNYDQTTFDTMKKFVQQSTTKCVIFVVDSRKQNIIRDSKGNDVRSNIKAIAKIVSEVCHIIILCNKQDITNETILNSDEIGNILDIDRTFARNKHCVIGCSLTENTNTEKIISYLKDNNIIKPINTENDNNNEIQTEELKFDSNSNNTKKKKASFANLFKRKNPSKKHNQVIMIFGLDKVGKTQILDSFNFGKKTKTNIAIFEAETIKYSNCEFHVWNYEQRSWPMAKSFFVNTSLVIFVIDATKIENIKSDKKNQWTVETYLKKLLGINSKENNNNNNNKKVKFTVNKNGMPQMNENNNPFVRNVSSESNHETKEENNSSDMWPLNCPFLFYINKCDLDNANITQNDLEKEIELSRLMKSKGIKYFVQTCSAKTKQGIYDGLVWCYNNGILTSIPEIKLYADKNDSKLPQSDDNNTQK